MSVVAFTNIFMCTNYMIWVSPSHFICMNKGKITWRYSMNRLKAKFQCHPARCLLPVEIMQRCGLATGPATVELLPYLLPY